MKVQKLSRSPAATAAVQDEISKVFECKAQSRVCGPHCSRVCEQCGSIACQCNCVSSCPDAREMLSIDPERYPIEPGIVPIVYEMKRLGVFRPCWSCEGHTKPDGRLWKLPSVWFYCDSTVHVRLLADGLKTLSFEKKIQAIWMINIAFSEPTNPDTTYSLEPNFNHNPSLTLPVLQQDVIMIANSLEAFIGDEARRLRRTVAE